MHFTGHGMIFCFIRGAEPSELAFSAAVGLTFGVFPICGKIVVYMFVIFVHVRSVFSIDFNAGLQL